MKEIEETNIWNLSGHQRDLKEAMHYLRPVYPTEILFGLLKTIYNEEEAKGLALEWFNRNDMRFNGKFDELFGQARSLPDPNTSLTRHYLEELYGEASLVGWKPKPFRKGANRKRPPSKGMMKAIQAEKDSAQNLGVELATHRQKDRPEEEQSVIPASVINWEGGLYTHPAMFKKDFRTGEEGLNRVLKKIADCEVHVEQALEHHPDENEDEETGAYFTYVVRLQNASKTINAEISAEDLLHRRNFSRLLLSKGFTHFTGSEEDFGRFLNFLIKKQRYPVVHTRTSWGEIEPGIFLFRNGVYDTRESRFYPADSRNRILYRGKHLVCPVGTEQVQPPRFCPAGPDSQAVLSQMLQHWERLNGEMNVRLSVGFAIASMFSRQIMKLSKLFPLLFYYGPRGTGKSTSMDWVMAMVGYAQGNRQSVSKSNTLKSINRRMTLSRYYPFAFDDYRHHRGNSHAPNLDSSILNWSHHTGTGIARKTQDTRTRDFPMKATVLMTGNEKPTDEAVLDRLILLVYRKRLDKKELEQLADLFRNSSRWGEFVALLLEHYQHVQTILFERLPYYNQKLIDRGLDGRTSQKYAGILAALDTVPEFLPSLSSWQRTGQEFFETLVEAIRKEKQSQEENHPLLEFFSEMNLYALEAERGYSGVPNYRVLDQRHYKIIEKAQIKDAQGKLIGCSNVLAIHLGRIWQTLNNHHSLITQNYSKEYIQSMMEQSPFYVTKSQQVYLWQDAGGGRKANLRCYYLNLAELEKQGILENLLEAARLFQ